MKKVWKYNLDLKEEFELVMPRQAKPIHVDLQNEIPTIWVEVREDNEAVPYKIYCFGTGWDIPTELTHIGTVQLNGFVWHFYWDE